MPAITAGGWSLRRALAAVGICLVAVGATLATTAQPAAAHATLLSTVPAGDELLASAPEAVELSFDEPVEVLEGAAIRVFGPDGERVDRGAVDVDGPTLTAPIDGAQRGTYTVAWRVLSGDSHNLSGSFVFHVGARSGAVRIDNSDDPIVNAAGTLGRFLAFAGTTMLFGTGALAALARSDVSVVGQLRRLAVAGSAAGLVGVLLVLVARAAASSGRSLPAAFSLTAELTTSTRPGVLTALRGASLTVGLVLACVRGVWRRAAHVAVVPALAAMVCVSVAGHAWTSDHRVLAVTADIGHQVAAGMWIGGAMSLIAGLRATERRTQLARRFSTAALASATLIAISGTVLALIQVGSLDALTSTGYGQLLMAKIGGFAVLVTFGWLNRRHLIPIVAKAASPLLRSLRWEVAVAFAVLALTAVLVNQPPARSSVERPFAATTTADGATVQITVAPAKAGSNDLHLYFFDTTTAEVLPVDAVEVTASTGDIPPRRLEVTPITASHVSAYGASLSSPGSWTINVTLVRAGTPTTVSFEVPIR